MMRPLDAWTVARHLAGMPVNGEARAVSECFRLFANHLASLPLEGRTGAWEAYLCGQDDPTALVKAVARADPSGPPPEADTTSEDEVEGWEPVRLCSLPSALPFPTDVLPAQAARLVLEGAASIGCPPDFLAVAILAVAAGAIGRSVSLRLKGGYFASSGLFAACVGPPSDGKTPAFKLVGTAARRIDAILAAEHAQALERWEEENRPKPGEQKAKPSAPPKPRRIDVDDITMEAVPMRLADNPRGLFMFRDELSALSQGMNQYKGGKGNDRSVVLKIWSGDAIRKDRVSDIAGVPIRCDHPCMTIFGGLPPAMLGTLQDAKGSADGFVDRFLFTYPETIPVPDWSERGVPDDVVDEWCALVSRLWARPLNVQDGRSIPHVARFTPDGKAAWETLYNQHAAEMNASDFPPALRGPWGKLREYAGRIALVLACLDHAADPFADTADIPFVDPRIVEGAWRLVAYFKNHARRVHMTISDGLGVGGGDTVRVVLAWLREGGHESFSEHDFKQARRTVREDELTDAFTYLAERNAIRVKPATELPRKGRRHSTIYEVNPSLIATRNP